MRRLLLVAGLFAPAVALSFPLPPLAPTAEVASIAAEIDLPAVHPPARPAPTPHAKLAFPAAALKGYGADVSVGEILKPGNRDKYEFRRAVLATLGLLRDGWANDGRQFRPTLPADVTPLTKADIAREQDVLALTIPRLEAALFRLEAFEAKRADEPKRWQAHFDLAMAELHARLAVMDEYNLLLGNVRREILPPLDPARGAGYRLRTVEVAGGPNDARRYAKEARERYERVIENHPNTPWAVAARRALAAPPGLAWEPAPKG
jgi:hypothetical protein